MRNVIPFRKKKKQLDWITGITPRKTGRTPGKRRIPPALPGGLVIAALIAMVLWLPADPTQLIRTVQHWFGP